MQIVFVVLSWFSAGSCIVTSCFCCTGGWALNLKELKLIQTIGKGEFGGTFHTGPCKAVLFKSIRRIQLNRYGNLKKSSVLFLMEKPSTAHFLCSE